MEIITSLQNPRVKQATKLRDRRERDEQQRILIDGAREIRLALRGGVRIVEVFWQRELCTAADVLELLERLHAAGAELVEVSPRIFEKLAFGDRVEGILAVAETPRRDIWSLTLPAAPLVAVIESVEKPGNLGAIMRSADAAGVSAVIAADPLTDCYNPNAIRASLGAIFTVPLCAATSAETQKWLAEGRLTILAARVDGDADYTAVNFRAGCAIVLGSEARGLSDKWSGPNVTAMRMPMLGVVDSLNVSAAAAVLFYEALRQRGVGEARPT